MSVTEDVVAAEAARYAAMLASDTEALGTWLDAELVYTHSDGSRDTRASYLEKVAAGHFRYLRIDHPVDRIITIGDGAAVIGRMIAQVSVEGQDRLLANACLAVYRLGPLGWQLVAYQPTPLPA